MAERLTNEAAIIRYGVAHTKGHNASSGNGGAGFIGSILLSQTLRSKVHPDIPSDVRITVLDALTYASGRAFIEADIQAFPDRCRLIQGSILDRDLVFALVNECDAVVHFAAESHNDNSLHDPTLFVETNVNGTLTLLEAAREYDKRFHHVSTDEVYGDLPLNDSGKFHEASPYRPSSPYSASKAGADHLVNAWVRSFGLNATISNCSNNYGPRQHVEKLVPRTITERLQDAARAFTGLVRTCDWIHVDDHNGAFGTFFTRARRANLPDWRKRRSVESGRGALSMNSWDTPPTTSNS